MASQVVVPTEHGLRDLNLSDPEVQALIEQAEKGNEQDRQLSLLDAVKKYKKACFWAMALSTSLIMEGYDVVIVSFPQLSLSSTDISRLPLSMPRHSSSTDLVLSILKQEES